MASPAIGAFVNINHTSRITDPPAVVFKDTHAIAPTLSAYELDELSCGSRYNGPSSKEPPSGAATPLSPKELEMSRPPSPKNDEAVDVVQSLSNPPMNRYRLISACLMCFGNGLNDSAPGALIPYMESDYKIGYALVSLIFVTNALGFISAAPFTDLLGARLGRAKALILAETLMIVSYIALVCAPPFPVVAISFLLTGLGLALNLSLNNVFCANLADPATALGAFHGSYGVGGTIGPLIATALVSHGRRCLGLPLLRTRPALPPSSSPPPGPPAPTPRTHPPPRSHRAPLTLALRNKTTLLGALFIFAYQGAEVSISGWVISFLLTYRHSSPRSTGYVTAGFWAGITLGRFGLTHLAHHLGERSSVAGLTALAVLFQLLVWFVPNVVGDGVAVAVVGLVLGPVYPCATVVFSRLLGRRLQMSGLSFIGATGSSGGAAAPFLIGLVAQRAGTWVLHPICIALFAGMIGCWFGLPRVGKRRD
ncbi:MAG: hypothetical protein FRX48_08540 [Lasallia pustulata]|uniref:Major facilitator superfamily (MFS) profile domain-containing protein n=1 Tax=Lasallia pustulata TaxID=136370 RepID=A0A5M8PG49_9LECA|nr:MAG: hypothetical protein FRX48_08540 [Lasallia pustulata]